MEFYIRSALLGISLAMDACAVSMTNGMRFPNMSKRIMFAIPLLFGVFQGFMPFIGYSIGHALVVYIEEYIPWIALGILVFLGLNMLFNSFGSNAKEPKHLTYRAVLFQALATSLDALSIGFTISNYRLMEALQCMGIIASITAIFCYFGIQIGKKFGIRFGRLGEFLGGLILIGIGIEIFMKGMK